MVDRFVELLRMTNREDDGQVVVAFQDRDNRQALDLHAAWDKASAAPDQYSVDEIIEQLAANIPIEKQKVAETTGPNLKKHRPHFGLRYPAAKAGDKDQRLIFGLAEAEKVLATLSEFRSQRQPAATAAQ